MFKSTITVEEINELQPLKFEGPIQIITRKHQVQKAISILQKSKCIGFDTETKPAFKKNQTNKVALLQLSTEKEAFLFRLHYLTEFEQLFSLLSNPEIIKIGVAVSDDLKDLIALRKFKVTNFIELQSYVKSFNIENISLKKLCAIVLDGRVSKRQQRSNWEAKVLSEAQQRYAATDAWASLMIYKKLEATLKKS